MSVTIDLTAGEVRMAGLRLEVVADASAVAPGAIRVGGVTVVKPLSYAVRSTLCARHRSPSALAPAVLAAATEGPSEGPAFEALALHLAGADPDRALPGFSDVALVMGRVFGWAPDQLAETPAQWVDGLAASALDLEPAEAHDGWTSYRISGESAPDGESVVGLRDRLAADLIRRAAARLTVQAAPDEESVSHRRAADRSAGADGTPEPTDGTREHGSTRYDPMSAPTQERPSSSAEDARGGGSFDPGAIDASGGARFVPDVPGASVNGAPDERATVGTAGPPNQSAPTNGPDTASPAVPPPATATSPVGSNGANPDRAQIRPRAAHRSTVPSAMTAVRRLEALPRAVGRENRTSGSVRGDTGAPLSAHVRPTAEAQPRSATVDMADASLADRIARALHDECDLRGTLRW